MLELLKETDHLTFELSKLVEYQAKEHVTDPAAHLEAQNRILKEAYGHIDRKSRRARKRVRSADAQWNSLLSSMSQSVITARHLKRTLHRLCNDLAAEVVEAKSEIETQVALLPGILRRVRNSMRTATNQFRTEIISSTAIGIERDIERKRTDTSKLGIADHQLRGAMSDFLFHLFPKRLPAVVTAETIQTLISRTRARAIRKQKAILIYPENEDIAAMITREVESELEKIDIRYSPVLRDANRRRADLKSEIRALSTKIRRAEARRLQEEAVFSELASHGDDFEVSRRQIDESLSMLQIDSHQRANERAKVSGK
jgi:hypothetical protein